MYLTIPVLKTQNLLGPNQQVCSNEKKYTGSKEEGPYWVLRSQPSGDKPTSLQ
jgi:hypothetical protein